MHGNCYRINRDDDEDLMMMHSFFLHPYSIQSPNNNRSKWSKFYSTRSTEIVDSDCQIQKSSCDGTGSTTEYGSLLFSLCPISD